MDNLSKPPNATDKDRSNGDYEDKKTNLQQMFSSFFFGLLTQFDDRYNVGGSNTQETLLPQTNATSNDSSSAVDVGLVNDNEKDEEGAFERGFGHWPSAMQFQGRG